MSTKTSSAADTNMIPQFVGRMNFFTIPATLVNSTERALFLKSVQIMEDKFEDLETEEEVTEFSFEKSSMTLAVFLEIYKLCEKAGLLARCHDDALSYYIAIYAE